MGHGEGGLLGPYGDANGGHQFARPMAIWGNSGVPYYDTGRGGSMPPHAQMGMGQPPAHMHPRPMPGPLTIAGGYGQSSNIGQHPQEVDEHSSEKDDDDFNGFD